MSGPLVAKTFRPVTHVIFDLDGLLLNTEIFYTDVLNTLCRKYGKEFTWEVKHQMMGRKERDSAQFAIETVGLPISVDEYLVYVREELLRLLPTAQFMPGAEQLVKHLHRHGIPIAIATGYYMRGLLELYGRAEFVGCTYSRQDDSAQNALSIFAKGSDFVEVDVRRSLSACVLQGSDTFTFQKKTTNHGDFLKMFLHCVLSGDDPEVKNGKPAPDIFLVCASRFPVKVEPRDILVFEDALNGVTAAVAAGMQVVAVPDERADLKDFSHATLILKSLLEFRPEDFGLPPY